MSRRITWNIEFDESARRTLRKLNPHIQGQILRDLRTRIATGADPRLCKPLAGEMADIWRYRVEDHRIACRIEDDRLFVLVVTLGHRKHVYHQAPGNCSAPTAKAWGIRPGWILAVVFPENDTPMRADAGPSRPAARHATH